MNARKRNSQRHQRIRTALKEIHEGVGAAVTIFKERWLLCPRDIPDAEEFTPGLIRFARMNDESVQCALSILLSEEFSVPDGWLQVRCRPDIVSGKGATPFGDPADSWCHIFGLDVAALSAVFRDIQATMKRAEAQPGYIEKLTRRRPPEDSKRTQGTGTEPMWQGEPVRCFHDQEDMSKPVLTPEYVSAPERFGISKSSISKAFTGGKLTKRMPTKAKGAPYAYLFREISALVQKAADYAEG